MRNLIRLLSGVLVLAACPVVVAQGAAIGLATAAQEQAAGSQPPASGQPEMLLRTPSGELVPLKELLGAEVVDELLNRSMNQRSVPQASIRRLEVDGKVARDVATLKLELQIQVRPEAEWVSVPLAFGDVYLTGFDHSSEFTGGKSALESGRANERKLSLFGAGLHTIRLELIGKARAMSAGVMQLSLNLPTASASHATIAFATPVEISRLPTGAVDKSTRNEQGITSIEFWGLEGAAELAWSEVAPLVNRTPVIQVENRLKLDLTTIPVALSGSQVLQISGSPVTELQLSFPEGFQLQEVDARNAAGVSILNRFEIQTEAGLPSAIVRLTSAVEGTLTLSLDLELVNRTFPQDIRVILPSVAGANIQSGDLDLLFPTGLLVQQTKVEGAQRKRVATQTDLTTTATAFRMRSTASEIILHVEETEAQFAVSPELTVQPEGQNVILTARYPISVLQGSLLDLAIHWPGISGGDWQLLPGNSRLITDKGSRPLSLQLSDAEPDVLQLTFPERQSGEFAIEFKAFAALDAVRAGAVQLLCPEVSSRRGQPFVLKTIESDEYSVRPISMGTGELLPAVPVPAAPPSDPAVAGRRIESWLQQDPSIPVRLELPQQAPAVRAEIQLGLEPRQNGIEVTERIQFTIEHRDLSSLSLNVPEGLHPVVRLDGSSEPLRANIDSPTAWTFRLPEARRGRLDVDVQYLWKDAKAGTASRVLLPIVLPVAAEILSVEAGTTSVSGLSIPDDAGWTPVFSEQFDAAWLKPSSAIEVPVQVADRMAVAQAGPDLILVRSQLVGSQTLTTTLAVFESAPQVVTLETPSQIALDGIELDGELLTSPTSQSRRRLQAQPIDGQDAIRWIIDVPEATRAAGKPVIVELRMRELTTVRSSLWHKAALRRAVIVGESRAVPVVWYIGSGDVFQPASVSQPFSQLTAGRSVRLPWTESVRDVSDRQLRAIVSAYSDESQTIIRDHVENWLSLAGRTDMYFGSATSVFLKVQLVSGVGLLLLSAAVCVAVFVLSSAFPRFSILFPVLLLSAGFGVGWLLVPDWTTLLLVPVIVGCGCGIVSVVFQRLLSERRFRLPRSGGMADHPTVFGFTGLLAPSVVTRPESGIRATGSAPMSLSAGSAN